MNHPPRTRIKICGISTPETARAAADAGADAIGLVFVEKSPRYVELERARQVLDALPAMVEPVGLFADAPVAAVLDTVRTLGLRTVQLHGREGPAYVEKLLASFPGGRIIKALHFEPGCVAQRLDPWRNTTPMLAGLLWDTPPELISDLPGGAGRALDWDALAQASGQNQGATLPVFLAGGLTAENVGHAIVKVRPFAVDVSSGVEAERGVKDPERIAAFCDAVRAADTGRPIVRQRQARSS